MNAFFSGLGGSAFLFIFTLFSGILLSRAGNPYPTVVFNIHKLVAIGTVFIIVRNIYRLQHTLPSRSVVGPGSLLTIGLLFAILVVSGGLLSFHSAGLLQLQPSLLKLAHVAHQVAPLLALIVAGLALTLLPEAPVAQ